MFVYTSYWKTLLKTETLDFALKIKKQNVSDY